MDIFDPDSRLFSRLFSWLLSPGALFSWLLFPVALFFFLVGVLALAFAALSAGPPIALMLGETASVDGVVVHNQLMQDLQSWVPIVKYSVGDKEFELKGRFGHDPRPEFEIGDHVPVLYRVDAPYAAGLNTFRERWQSPILFSAIGISAGAIGLLLLSRLGVLHAIGDDLSSIPAALFLVVWGAVFTAIGATSGYPSYRMTLYESAVVKGVVVELNRNRPVVRYEVDGMEFELVGTVESTNPPHKVSDLVPVAYMVHDPSDAILDTLLERATFPVWFGGMGIIVFSIGSGILIFKVLRLLRRVFT